MGIHVASVVNHVYFFDEDDGTAAYNARKPYAAVLTINWLGPTWVYLSALSGGRFTKEHRKELVNWLRSNGVKRATFERHGRLLEVF